VFQVIFWPQAAHRDKSDRHEWWPSRAHRPRALGAAPSADSESLQVHHSESFCQFPLFFWGINRLKKSGHFRSFPQWLTRMHFAGLCLLRSCSQSWPASRRSCTMSAFAASAVASKPTRARRRLECTGIGYYTGGARKLPAGSLRFQEASWNLVSCRDVHWTKMAYC
jgi:hypothetical protein